MMTDSLFARKSLLENYSIFLRGSLSARTNSLFARTSLLGDYSLFLRGSLSMRTISLCARKSPLHDGTSSEWFLLLATWTPSHWGL
jgi:hypothetical protein